jgi:hypothetical protein
VCASLIASMLLTQAVAVAVCTLIKHSYAHCANSSHSLPLIQLQLFTASAAAIDSKICHCCISSVLLLLLLMLLLMQGLLVVVLQ